MLLTVCCTRVVLLGSIGYIFNGNDVCWVHIILQSIDNSMHVPHDLKLNLVLSRV